MANENQESPVLRVLTAEHAVEPRADLVANEQQDTSAARALVQQMVNCGEWPPPELLQEIVNMGDAAVEPLLDLIRARPQSWPATGLTQPRHRAPERAAPRQRQFPNWSRFSQSTTWNRRSPPPTRLSTSGRPALTLSSTFARIRQSRDISEPTF